MNNLGAGLKTQDWGKFIPTCKRVCSRNTNFGST